MPYIFAVVGEYVGSAIYLEAQEINVSIRLSRKQSLEGQKELRRLRQDGHHIEETKREYVVTPSEDSIRNTLLYRTLLHEVGHWVQYDRETLTTETALWPDLDVAYDLYFAKPSIEREQFAHRYADEMSAQLRKTGAIPFAPMLQDQGSP